MACDHPNMAWDHPNMARPALEAAPHTTRERAQPTAAVATTHQTTTTKPPAAAAPPRTHTMADPLSRTPPLRTGAAAVVV